MATESERFTGRNWFFKIFPLIAVPGIFLLHNLNHFRVLLFTTEAYWLATAYLLLPAALYFSWQRITKQSKERSLIVTLLFALFFFFFGAVQDVLIQHSITKMLGKTYILPILFLTPVAYVLLGRPNTTLWLRSITLALLFFFLSECALLLWSLPHFNQEPAISYESQLQNAKAEGQDSLNVHHIIFDGYANSTTLKKLFNYQNPLDSFLLNEGFYIASQAKSNYNFTPYSLAATLNLQYLQLNEEQLVRDYKNYLLGARVYQENSIFRYFKNKQYATSHYAVLDNNRHLDMLGTFVPKTPQYSLRNQTFERVLMNPWLWQKVRRNAEETIPPAIKESLHYYVQYNHQALKHALASAPEPHFRFTHFLLPHEPYAFSKNSVNALRLSDLMDHTNGYIKQVEHANGLIVKLVTELKKNTRNVIILQGDHGFRSYNAKLYSPYTQNETLNTFYFPDQNYNLLYQNISPVNTYRVVLKKYFNQTLTLLKDSAIIPQK